MMPREEKYQALFYDQPVLELQVPEKYRGPVGWAALFKRH